MGAFGFFWMNLLFWRNRKVGCSDMVVITASIPDKCKRSIFRNIKLHQYARIDLCVDTDQELMELLVVFHETIHDAYDNPEKKVLSNFELLKNIFMIL